MAISSFQPLVVSQEPPRYMLKEGDVVVVVFGDVSVWSVLHCDVVVWQMSGGELLLTEQ